MGHPNIDNQTAFAFESLVLVNENGYSLLVPVTKATYTIREKTVALLSGEQLPVSTSGEYWDDPAKSSYKYEPETAFIKPTTDVVLIGHAYPAEAGDKQVDVTLRVGPVEKTVRAVGDRYWVKTLGITNMTEPEPIERIPLVYERAFGGWDSGDPDPETSKFEPRNPVGVGFKYKKFEEGMPLPNLEDPRRRLKYYGDTPPPAGFGFTSPHWQPRAKLAGTYDEAWQKNRAPLLPTDFDPRFFNAASLGLIAPEYLRGDEPVLIENATPNGRLAFNLPGVRPPTIRVQLRDREDELLETNLNTVIVNTDENLLLMLWRTNLVLRNGPHDVVAIEITAEGAPAPVETP